MWAPPRRLLSVLDRLLNEGLFGNLDTIAGMVDIMSGSRGIMTVPLIRARIG